MKKKLAKLTLLSALGCIGYVQDALAVDVKFGFTFLDADAKVQGYFIVDDSVLPTIYNGGLPPVNDGFIDFNKVHGISLRYSAGELAEGGGDFTLADYSSLRWTSDVPLDFYTDVPPAGNDIAWQWGLASPTGCGSGQTTRNAFAFGRAPGSSAPTEVGSTCMAGTNPSVLRQPSLLSLYLDTNYVPAAAVPEPSTYGLMFAGLGALWFGTRRRKS
ncbi:MAG: PEP-CTERM sorting domain-containing protein [Burkholderiales bacterium]|nr:PEP-CTERM sorting domain-containing protein [Burkholderiales bacterium]